MPQNSTPQKPLATIWRVPDELWIIIEPILKEHDPPKCTGRPRIDQRQALDAIIFRMRSGCQWNQLPKEEFPDDSSVHRTLQRWVELGVFDLIWEKLIEECEELGGVDFEWQAADGAMGKARFGGSRRPQSHRQSQKRGQTLPAGRGRWRSSFGGDSRSERARLQAVGGHARCHRGPTARSHRTSALL
jgi:transposase